MERGTAFNQLLIRAVYLKLTGTVLHLRMVLRHESLAEGVEFVRTGTVDAVHAGTSESLGNERGLLLHIHVDDVRPDLIGQRVLTARVERTVPGVVRIARGIGGGAVAAVAECQNDGGGGNHVAGTVQHMKSHGAGNMSVFFQKAGDHHMIEHVRPHGAQPPGDETLDLLPFGDIDVPGRFSASGSAQIAAVGIVQKMHALAFQKLHHGGHDFAPFANLLFRHAGSRLVVHPHQIVDGVFRLVGAEHGHK